VLGSIKVPVGFKKRQGVIFQIKNSITIAGRLDTFRIRKRG
jgi:hypothetical protein